jgi:hypothetical protein
MNFIPNCKVNKNAPFKQNGIASVKLRNNPKQVDSLNAGIVREGMELMTVGDVIIDGKFKYIRVINRDGKIRGYINIDYITHNRSSETIISNYVQLLDKNINFLLTDEQLTEFRNAKNQYHSVSQGNLKKGITIRPADYFWSLQLVYEFAEALAKGIKQTVEQMRMYRHALNVVKNYMKMANVQQITPTRSRSRSRSRSNRAIQYQGVRSMRR